MGVRQCQVLGRIKSLVRLKVVVNVLYKNLYIFLSIAQKPASSWDAGKSLVIGKILAIFSSLFPKKCKPAAIIIFFDIAAGKLHLKKCGWRDSNSQGLCPHAPQACAYTNSATSARSGFNTDYIIA